MVATRQVLNNRDPEFRVFEERVEHIVTPQVEHTRVFASDHRVLVCSTLLEKQFAVDRSALKHAHHIVTLTQFDNPLDDNEDTQVVIALVEEGLAAIEHHLTGARRQLRQRLRWNSAENIG